MESNHYSKKTISIWQIKIRDPRLRPKRLPQQKLRRKKLRRRNLQPKRQQTAAALPLPQANNSQCDQGREMGIPASMAL